MAATLEEMIENGTFDGMFSFPGRPTLSATKQAWEEFWRIRRESLDRFKACLFEDLKVTDDPHAEEMWNEVWGENSGYYPDLREIHNQFKELVNKNQ